MAATSASARTIAEAAAGSCARPKSNVANGRTGPAATSARSATTAGGTGAVGYVAQVSSPVTRTSPPPGRRSVRSRAAPAGRSVNAGAAAPPVQVNGTDTAEGSPTASPACHGAVGACWYRFNRQGGRARVSPSSCVLVQNQPSLHETPSASTVAVSAPVIVSRAWPGRGRSSVAAAASARAASVAPASAVGGVAGGGRLAPREPQASNAIAPASDSAMCRPDARTIMGASIRRSGSSGPDARRRPAVQRALAVQIK